MAWNDDLIPGTPAHTIASTTHSHLRVLAGPGTGKSFAVKKRIARLLEDGGVPPSSILAVTFTRVAAEDLHRELIEIQTPGAGDLQGRTLHGLAMSILMQNDVLGVLGRTPRPLDDYEIEPLLADLEATHGNKWKRRKLIRAYGAGWARLQSEVPGYVKEPSEQAFEDSLLSWLKRHDAMLMDEIIPQLLQYLRLNPGCPERSMYTHLLIDEYQDLNKAEQEVLHLLGEHASVCIVGDDDQSIYSFKHARPEGIREWIHRQPSEQHTIQDCWRCPTTVVRMANSLISRNPDRLGALMTEIPGNGVGEVVVRQYDTAAREATEVASKIADLIESGVHPKEIIVLAQRRPFANLLTRALRDVAVPAKSYYAESSLDDDASQERYTLYKLLQNPEDKVALRWLLGFGRPNWYAPAYARILERSQSDGTTPWQTLEGLDAGAFSIPRTATILERFRFIREELDALRGIQDVGDFINAWLPDDPNLKLLREDVEQIQGDAQTVSDLFSSLNRAITEPDVPSEITDVRIMSLHKSKGLSSPYVFIVGCVEGLLPSAPEKDTTSVEREAKLQEDRRLFYVGITRVKSKLPSRAGFLALTYPNSMPLKDAMRSKIKPVRTAGRVAFLQASRFLGEMAPHLPQPTYNQPI